MSDLPVVPDGVAEIDLVGVRKGAFGSQGSGDTSGFGGLVAPIVMPGASIPPFGGWYDEVAEELALSLVDAGVSGAVEKIVIDRGEMTFYVMPENLVAFMTECRDEPALRFEMCTSVSGVHFPHDKNRELHIVYALLSITHNRRIRVEVSIPDSDRHLPSLVALYPSVDWHERETWDFFGVIFDGHPALTRIQMPDDWVGHPQRKDYPLGGIPVEYKGATIPAPDHRRSYN
ncbi:MAG: NADH-quinone oxidoreductase subunit C [Candidatus Nanopelagicales bacterium]|jgi:NADH-quinone oxidoreductase subunit C|nr:NADH-quinone oxidoreductase subunit C [Actinomycetota bacterium]MDC1474072.1 NADH-quinone oxidoreductase subunit C [Candidatus Nanopelagicales bacterium]NCG02726.1 NADH-quinone oxidoreductase subunit C [Actinomycetales bacterium]MBT5182425.1 NADH-quinone oxidoreductase subunit C [Actinomycetota bacterium]MBT5502515.1 NADH-quinone oxidoreductase subunit C [Actinomycetota bacterium]